MSELIPTDIAGYKIDPATGLIINTNQQELGAYKEKLQSKKRILALERDVKALKAQVAELLRIVRNE